MPPMRKAKLVENVIAADFDNKGFKVMIQRDIHRLRHPEHSEGSCSLVEIPRCARDDYGITTALLCSTCCSGVDPGELAATIGDLK